LAWPWSFGQYSLSRQELRKSFIRNYNLTAPWHPY
jgi:hypothetical protein